MANRRHLCSKLPDCLVWICRIWGILTVIVLWGVGVEVAYRKHLLGAYLFLLQSVNVTPHLQRAVCIHTESIHQVTQSLDECHPYGVKVLQMWSYTDKDMQKGIMVGLNDKRVIAVVISFFEIVFIIHFWVVYKAQDERDACVRVWTALSLLDDWKKGLFYFLLAPGCLSQPHTVWLAVVPGILLVIAGILYCIKTVTNREDIAMEEVSKIETYGRFDEVQEDIEENLAETIETVSPDGATVADQVEIMDL